MDLSFHLVQPDDIDTVLPMMKELCMHDKIPFNENAAKEALRNFIKNEIYGRAFLIKISEEICGYIIITFGYSIEFRGRDAFIDELFIKENFRGKGIGSEAINFAEKVCKESGIKALHLEVERENLRAQKLYRKAGFNDHNRYLMTKWLT